MLGIMAGMKDSSSEFVAALVVVDNGGCMVWLVFLVTLQHALCSP